MKQTNVAFLLTEVKDLSGAGGAERFFYDFYKRNNQSTSKQINIYFYTDCVSNLEKVSYNASKDDKLIKFKSFRNNFFKSKTDKVKFLNKPADFIRNILTFVPLYLSCLKNNIKVLHLPLYESKDYRLVWLFDKFTLAFRPKISLSIVDCRIPYRYFLKDNVYYYSNFITYGDLFNKVKIDGVLSWYELFKKFAEENNVIKHNKFIYCVKSRYSIVDLVECIHQKEKQIVFAGRLDDQKDPEFFIRAVNEVVKQKKAEGYIFKIYGKGPLQTNLEKYISENNLKDFVSVGFNPQMKEVFVKSQCFVSTQLYENFPSMSMAEAMACENVIIAKNVGQTNLFVKDGYNGFLCEESNIKDLAEKIIRFIELDGEKKNIMGKNSSLLMQNVHNFRNFQEQFEEYISKLLIN
jgi:glycosyltransferase involved in cell wall biosynthesis